MTIADGANGGVFSVANECDYEYLLAKLEAPCLEHVYTKKRFLSFASIPDGGIFNIVACPVEYVSFRSGATDENMSQVTSTNEWRNGMDDCSLQWAEEEFRQPTTTRRCKTLQCIDTPEDFYKKRSSRIKDAARGDLWKVYLGSDNLQVAELCSQLAQDYMVHGNYIEAMKMYHKSLSIRQTFLGKNHPTVAKTYNNVGTVYWMQGEHEEAKRMHQLALTTRLDAIEERYSSADDDNKVKRDEEILKPCYSGLLSTGSDDQQSHRPESGTTHTVGTQGSDTISTCSKVQVASTDIPENSHFHHPGLSYLIQH